MPKKPNDVDSSIRTRLLRPSAFGISQSTCIEDLTQKDQKDPSEAQASWQRSTELTIRDAATETISFEGMFF